MARSTREGIRRLWVAYRPKQNDTLQVQGFADTYESVNGGPHTVVETAEQKSAVVATQYGGRVMVGATTAQEAIEMARREKI